MNDRARRTNDPDYLDDPSDRGDVSQEGFGDYEKDFHPSDVEVDPKPASGDGERKAPVDRASPVDLAARKRFEVHFRMMKLGI